MQYGSSVQYADEHSQQQTYYQLLGLTFLASHEEIRSAYKRLALLWHPDRNSQCLRDLALAKFRALQQAYSVLSRPDRRKAYHMEFLECWDMRVSLKLCDPCNRLHPPVWTHCASDCGHLHV
ncbi:hypothetical protein ABBQ32_004988 [Trebouxia sp. C0010 RCD-2024]